MLELIITPFFKTRVLLIYLFISSCSSEDEDIRRLKEDKERKRKLKGKYGASQPTDDEKNGKKKRVSKTYQPSDDDDDWLLVTRKENVQLGKSSKVKK